MAFALRPLLFKLHLYVAIAIAPFIVIIGLTGAIMAFENEISRLAHADVAYVTPAPPRLSLDLLRHTVATAYPDGRADGYLMAEAPGLSDRVAVETGQDGFYVYINPYTGKILGTGNPGAQKVERFLGAVHSIHQRLTLPRPGRDGLTRLFMSWITVAALFLVLSGIYLWWPRMRFAIGKGGGRPFWYDVHAVLGITATAFLILLSASGLVLGFQALTPLIYAATGSQPATPARISAPPSASLPHITMDRAVALARQALPTAKSFPIIIATPVGFVMTARVAGDHDPNARSQIAIGNDGRVMQASDMGSAPAGTRMLALNRSIHTGTILGIASKTAMCLASLILVLQVLSGMVMWIKRVRWRAMIPALMAAVLVAALGVATIFIAPVASREGGNRIEQRR